MLPPAMSAAQTTTACESDTNTPLRAMKRCFAGGVPSGYELIRHPDLAIFCASECDGAGPTRSTPQGRTANVRPSTARQPRCAATSQPDARPLPTTQPARAAWAAKAKATGGPVRETRDPTTARRGAEHRGTPRQNSGGADDSGTTGFNMPPDEQPEAGNSNQKIKT
jgi:hypothetical protein